MKLRRPCAGGNDPRRRGHEYRIRALIKPQGTVGPILGRLAAGDTILVYSEPLLDELLAKLALPRIKTKYHLDDEAIEAFLALVALRGRQVTPSRRVHICREWFPFGLTKTNVELWEERAMLRERMSKMRESIQLTANALKQALSLPLTESEEVLEQDMRR